MEGAAPLYLVRHGEVDAEPGRCWGWTDLELADEAATREALAAQLGLLDPAPARIVCSDLGRARATARLLGELVGVEPEPTPALRELHFGVWEGRSWPEIEQRWPELYWAYMERWRERAPPGGESWLELVERVGHLWYEGLVARRSPTVVVAHQGSLRALAGVALGLADEEAMRLRFAYARARDLGELERG